MVSARARGVRLAYTLHNLEQHEGRHGTLNRWANQALFRWADAVHVHDDSVAEAAKAAGVPAGRLWVVPHGSYVGCYPNTISRVEARERLGLRPADFVYLTLGGVRPYKGIEDLIAAFRTLPDSDAGLLIAGHAHEPAYAEEVRGLAAGDERIRMHLQHVADDEIQCFMNASDVCVLPYRHATTSGAAILALSFGRPIVVPALGPFPGLVAAAGGLLYEPASPASLAAALRESRSAGGPAAAERQAAYLESIAWERVARGHAAMYHAIAGGGAR